MRAVLIAIPEQVRGPRAIGRSGIGRPLALRQLDFALACGCEQILALGDPGSEETVLLSRAARAAGIDMRLATNAHGLLGLLKTADELLILAADLLPESPAAVEVLRFGQCVLVLPAELAVPAGFERIDRERAWAGVAVLRGDLVERLAELPPDSDAPAALLRIALQARVPERRLPPSVLTEGDWLTVSAGGTVPPAAEGWLRRQLRSAAPFDFTGRAVQAIMRRWAGALLGDRRFPGAFTAAGALLMGGGVALAWLGRPAVGFALLAPAILAMALGSQLRRIISGPFGRKRKTRWQAAPVPATLIDLALAACGVLAIEDDWLGRLFPVIVLMIAFHAQRLEERPRFLALLSNRMVVALLLALAAAVGRAEEALMLLALVYLLGDRLLSRKVEPVGGSGRGG